MPVQDSYAFDGAIIPYTSSALASTSSPELLQVESWTGTGSIEGLPAGQYFNNTYKALRMITDGSIFFYSKWCTGEREFYNMNTDPGQMKNRLGTPARGAAATYYGRAEAKLFTRLDALLMVAKSCKQDSCRNPWTTLFPNGQVTDLAGAMKAQYDTFFANQPKVSYSSCKLLLSTYLWNISNVHVRSTWLRSLRRRPAVSHALFVERRLLCTNGSSVIRPGPEGERAAAKPTTGSLGRIQENKWTSQSGIYVCLKGALNHLV